MDAQVWMIRAKSFDRLRFVNKENPGTTDSGGDSVAKPAADSQGPLVAGRDYYLERGLMVFTAEFLRARGYCCESGCRHCPYSIGEIK